MADILLRCSGCSWAWKGRDPKQAEDRKDRHELLCGHAVVKEEEDES